MEIEKPGTATGGSKICSVPTYDLYTTRFGPIVNDDIEKNLFGILDDQGSKAVRAFALGDPAEVWTCPYLADG